MQFNFCISLMKAVTAAAYKLKEKLKRLPITTPN